MTECIFCQIATWKIPCHKIREDEDFLAFLDINPNTKGMTLVIPKQHYDSYAFDMPEEVYGKLMQATKKVAGILERGLWCLRVGMVMEGMGINHTHIKLYPMHGLKSKFVPMWSPERVRFDTYPWYLTTLLWPKADDEELATLAKNIRENAKKNSK